MDDSLYDLVVDELVDRQRLVKAELAERFKKTRPFRMKEVPVDERLYEYNTMTPEKLLTMIETYGREDVNQYIMEMERKMEQLKKGGKVNA